VKTVSIIIFAANLLKTLYTGFDNVDQEKVAGLEELKIREGKRHTIDRQSYIGIGMMVIGCAFLMFGSKKS